MGPPSHRVQAAHSTSGPATQRKRRDGDWVQTLVARVASKYRRPICRIGAGTCQEWQDEGAAVVGLPPLCSYLMHTSRSGVAAGRPRRTGACVRWRTSSPGGSVLGCAQKDRPCYNPDAAVSAGCYQRTNILWYQCTPPPSCGVKLSTARGHGQSHRISWDGYFSNWFRRKVVNSIRLAYGTVK
ncbi:hypothetical protein H4582DRAFT_679517 [Lactarius indigo]|nr:hypothetical protein H4582DRAFT_679517 [Lactarius indigo]